MLKDLDEGRRRSRRMWARVSFAFIMFMGSNVFGALLFRDDRAGIADALMTAWPILNMFLAVSVTVILAYLGISHMDKRLGGGEDNS